MTTSETIRLDRFEQQLEEIGTDLSNGAKEAVRAVREHRLLIEQAEWHGRGVLYHCQALFRLYQEVSSAVSARAQADADLLVMHSPDMQRLLFEFYAMTLLSREQSAELRD